MRVIRRESQTGCAVLKQGIESKQADTAQIPAELRGLQHRGLQLVEAKALRYFAGKQVRAG